MDALHDGMLKACRNVRWKTSVIRFEANALNNLTLLRRSILSGAYRIDKYQIFQITEPKKRTIAATRLKDRVFQRSLCDNGLYRDITEHFIYDNCACLKGKGISFAMRRTKRHLQHYFRQHGADGYVLKCDIHNFFGSIDHSKAKQVLSKMIADPKAYTYVCDVIDSFGGTAGIGLGSQISQLIALAYLDGLDHYLKDECRIKYYLRYNDDFYIIHSDKDYLKSLLKEIDSRIRDLGLELNPKTAIHPLRQGLAFLKWRLILTDSGKVILREAKSKAGRRRRKLRKMLLREREGSLAKSTARQSLDSYLAYMQQGDTYYQRRALIRYFQKTEKEVESMKILSAEERAYRLERENAALRAEVAKKDAQLEYVAMMTDVDMDIFDEEEGEIE